jgi:hypothetical protein
MPGRRPRIKEFCRGCDGRGCGHVSGLFARGLNPAGPDVVRVIPVPIRPSRSRSADYASGLGMGPQYLASRHSHPRFLSAVTRALRLSGAAFGHKAQDFELARR